jgi:phosphoribosylglycinamide formyltransferase-1
MILSKKVPIAVLISGAGTNLQALINAEKNFNYQIQLVISNQADANGITIAKRQGIKTIIVEHSKYSTRENFDSKIIELINSFNIKNVILAGFMRILTAKFTQQFLGKMLNTHPSLLPKYPGLNTHQKVLDNKDSEHGLSIHFVTEKLDNGPIIQQAKFLITNNSTVNDLKQNVKLLEHQCYPQVVDWLVTGKISLKNNQAYFNDDILDTPLKYVEHRH